MVWNRVQVQPGDGNREFSFQSLGVCVCINTTTTTMHRHTTTFITKVISILSTAFKLISHHISPKTHTPSPYSWVVLLTFLFIMIRQRRTIHAFMLVFGWIFSFIATFFTRDNPTLHSPFHRFHSQKSEQRRNQYYSCPLFIVPLTCSAFRFYFIQAKFRLDVTVTSPYHFYSQFRFPQ